MSEELLPTEGDQAITKVEGTPKASEKQLTRRDILNFHALAEVLGKKLKEGGELAEEYVRAKVAQETNAAAKTAAEAAELAARKEENEAKADLTRQQAVATFLENLTNISALGSTAQVLAISKLILENPELNEQLERIEEVLTRLKLIHGTIVGPASGGLLQPPSEGKIKRLTTKGFGFIETGSQKDLFFHHSALDGVAFDDLKEGQVVEYEVGKGPKGPRAENVRIVE